MQPAFTRPVLALAGLLVLSCSADDAVEPDQPALPSEALTPAFRFDPGNFVHSVNNRYFPLRRGTRFVYTGREEGEPERDIVDVTRNRRVVDGVEVTEVLDRVYMDGELAERTRDWYAQDKDGNVWYLGEDSEEIEDGQVVSTEGSWTAGESGARPGVIMPAHPPLGEVVPQEDAPGVAEDRARYISLDARVSVPYGDFDHCLETEEFTPLEPGVKELKFYCPHIGQVREHQVSGGTANLVLVAIRHGYVHGH